MNPRILIVEDDELNQLVIAGMIDVIMSDAEVVMTGDAEEALLRLGEQAFDVILSDMDLPGMDGQELARRVKNDLQLDTPLISVTAFAVVGDRERLLLKGFDDYVSKPIDLEQLRETLAKYLTMDVES